MVRRGKQTRYVGGHKCHKCHDWTPTEYDNLGCVKTLQANKQPLVWKPDLRPATISKQSTRPTQSLNLRMNRDDERGYCT